MKNFGFITLVRTLHMKYKHSPAASNTLHTKLLSKCTEATISKAQLTTKEKKAFCTKV